MDQVAVSANTLPPPAGKKFKYLDGLSLPSPTGFSGCVCQYPYLPPANLNYGTKF